MKQRAIATRTRFYWISELFLTKYHPSWRAILAYNALAYYAKGDTASCESFSIKTLAKLVDTSKMTMLRGLQELEEKGIISRTRRSRKTLNGRKMPLPTVYRLAELRPEDDERI